MKENAEALLVATKEIGLEVNADKTKYMVMSRDRNAGRGHSVKTDNSSIERVDYYYYNHHYLLLQGIYTYIPETNHVPREYSVSAILSLLFMVPISL